jgi:hypothetical protein
LLLSSEAEDSFAYFQGRKKALKKLAHYDMQLHAANLL